MEKGDTAITLAVAAILVLAFMFAYSQGLLDPVILRADGSPLFSGRWKKIEPNVNLTKPEVPKNLSMLETMIFRGVNDEREKLGLSRLKWNDDVAYVARLYSQEMAERGFFAHTSPEGESHGDRLNDKGIYYYNRSAENLAKINHVRYFTYINTIDNVINRTYRTLGEVAEESVGGWMNSSSHRENIEDPGFMESGIGVAYDKDEEMFYLTQLFISRIHCGYRGASCCRQEGYIPWCYRPWECMDSICE